MAVLAFGEGYLEEILDDGLFNNQLKTNGSVAAIAKGRITHLGTVAFALVDLFVLLAGLALFVIAVPLLSGEVASVEVLGNDELSGGEDERTETYAAAAIHVTDTVNGEY